MDGRWLIPFSIIAVILVSGCSTTDSASNMASGLFTGLGAIAIILILIPILIFIFILWAIYKIATKKDVVVVQQEVRKPEKESKREESEKDEKVKFCRYCGSKIDTDSKFCKSCGKKLW
jgi:amino acid permease